MKTCRSLDSCKEIRQSFFLEQDEISDKLENFALDVFDISCDYNVEQNLVTDKDTFIKEMSYRYREVAELSHEILQLIEREKDDYRELVNPFPNCESGRYKLFLDIENNVNEIKKQAEKYEDEFIIKVTRALNKHDLIDARKLADNAVDAVLVKLEENRRRLKHDA